MASDFSVKIGGPDIHDKEDIINEIWGPSACDKAGENKDNQHFWQIIAQRDKILSQ